MREFSYMRFVFALFDFMRAHCIGCIGEEGFLNVWGQRNFVSLCLVCLASASASERTSLILPIYQRYNLMLCCVFSCPSVDVNFSHLLLGSLPHFLM